MEDYFPVKMKRKSLDDVNDDFSDFSLSSPARKIRRLDADLPPISEEFDSEIPMTYEQFVPEQQSFGSSSGSVIIEEISGEPENEERAIVLFKPTNPPLLQSPSNFSVSLDPHLISGFKNQVLWSNQSNSWRLVNDEETAEDKNSDATNACLAVVPWVASQFPSALGNGVPPQTDDSETMDAEGLDQSRMDIEDDGIGVVQRNMNEVGGMGLNEGLHQWQQHCLIPQPSHNATTPIVWYR